MGNLLFIGTTEIIFILLMVVLVFGADKLPEIARGLGKGMRMLRDAGSDIRHEIAKSAKEADLSKSDLVNDVEAEINKVKDEVEDISGSIKRNS